MPLVTPFSSDTNRVSGCAVGQPLSAAPQRGLDRPRCEATSSVRAPTASETHQSIESLQ